MVGWLGIVERDSAIGRRHRCNRIMDRFVSTEKFGGALVEEAVLLYESERPHKRAEPLPRRHGVLSSW